MIAIETSVQRLSRPILAVTLVIFSCGSAFAEVEADNSGTNPAVLNLSAAISNEYRSLDSEFYYNVASLKYTEPFVDGRASVRLHVPVGATDLVPGDEVGLGHVGVKLSYVPYVDRSFGLILSNEVSAPAASEDVPGSGKWTTSPGVVLAAFLGPEIILAPAYVHTFSFAGDGDRGDINIGTFDLYAVCKPRGERWRLTADFTVAHDFENEKTLVSLEVAYGRNIAVRERNAALNGYIRPGVGIGDDRPCNFNIDVGLSSVGFQRDELNIPVSVLGSRNIP